ncbi:GMC family oxidoreductase [Steroidobacter flavus]|uniref:GMC family oxidoreductase n=1 Tax=Steroidobacter flavus TaxID=1842136 RepID=A0ABV8SXA9_9GAMM
MADRFDYIIVGAGSAGCVLANRLSADPHTEVLLIEAGPPDTNPMIHMPKGFAKIAASTQHCYYYEAEPGTAGRGGTETWIRGRMLGGSSSINGLQYQRGHAEDFNHWERDLGLNGWGWRDVSRIYRAMEDHELGGNEIRGAGGPLPITGTRNRTLLMDKLIEAGGELGLKQFEEPNSAEQEGIGYIFGTMKAGRRWSAAKAFLDPVRGRRNLHIVTDTEVQRILFEGKRATGVQCLQNGRPVSYNAHREVIVCAGTLHSPKLLQLSGIGPAAHLASLGIATIHDSPHVGANLREHLLFTVQYRLNGNYSQNAQYSGWRVLLHGMRYALLRSGLLACSPYDVTAFVRTRPGLDRPDAQLVAGCMSMDLAAWEGFSKGIKLESQPGAQILGFGLRPESQGSVMLRSSDPSVAPRIVHNYLTHEQDRQVAVSTVRYMRKLFDGTALRPYITSETLPGPGVVSDADILAAYERMSGPGYHATGTCSMGTVVDANLQVRGVTGLRVADISVLPTQISGNTNGPAMVVGWRAAELILQRSLASAA